MSTPSSIAAPPPQSIGGTTVIEAASPPLVLQMIPSAHHHENHADNQVQLATMMRSLVLDHQHPIALEIAGTEQQRCLLIRARNQDDLEHVKTQLHARLPHATFVPLAWRDDPFHLSPGETISVTELHAGQASYLPLQDFERRTPGDDPILGVLGALDALPSDLRAIAQIALVPAPPTWSHRYQRKALEHALEPERQHDRQKQATARGEAGAPSILFLLMGALFLAGYFLFQYDAHLLPGWVLPTVQALLAGNWQQVWAGPHRLDMEGIMGCLLLLPLILFALRRIWKRLVQAPMYDMRSVAEKTARSAYHVRLRLYVIGPAAAVSSPKIPLWHQLMSTLHAIGRGGWSTLHLCISHVLARQWKDAVQALVSPLVQRSKTLWQSQRGRDVRIAARIGRSGLSFFLFHLRAKQWRAAAQVVGRVIALIGRAIWSREQERWAKRKHRLVMQQQHWRAERDQQARRRQILARLTAAYRQYHLASGNYFVPWHVRTKQARRWVNQGTWWKGVRHSRQLLDVEALAALWHVPADETLPDLARISYRQSRSRLLPPSLEHTQWEIPIGISEHAGHRVPFGVPADCFESHMLIGGKSGEGKSTFMQHLALRRMQENTGLILIDPHGDLAEQVLRLVPLERWDDVVFLDLSDETFACGINPLDASMGRGRDKMISDLIKIFSNLWTSWGSRMEIAFEYSLRTLYEANRSLCLQGKEAHQYTLLDIMAVLTDESFCHALLQTITDPFILRWWASYYDPLSLQMQRDRVDPVLSKVAKFEGTIARSIVGQSLCSIDFTACIQQQKIVLIKLAKGVIGEDVARILGATLLGFLNIALEEQGKREGSLRQHVPIFIDEFQTLDGVDWGTLAELRKYGASFFLATQSLEYLREKQILPTVLANVKQLAIFRMSAEDARLLARELDVDPEDIVHLESLTCYLKFRSGWQQHPTFSGKLHFPPEGDAEDAQRIRERCQRRLMRPVSEITIEIVERLARTIGAVPAETDKQAKDTKTEPHQGKHAREDGGNRGRKAQEKQTQRSAVSSKPVTKGETTITGEITPMNWEETVGIRSDERTEEEQEGDCDD